METYLIENLEEVKRELFEFMQDEGAIGTDIEYSDDNFGYEVTDPSVPQIAVKLSYLEPDTYWYAQKEGDTVRCDYGSVSSYNNEVLEEMVTPYYGSLKNLKEIYPKDWKQIAIECGFEMELL